MMLPQSLQLGASCWNRIGAPPLTLIASASFAGRTKPIDGAAAVATASMKVTSFGVGVVTFVVPTAGAGVEVMYSASRLITPASSWLSRLRNFVASHLKM